MDFASVPLQALFTHNASTDQLIVFLESLYGHFSETVDEKDRFGTLQILLPTLKAHLMRLHNQTKEEDCLNSIVRPLIISSFSQDSVVSTESVHLLSNAVAHFMAWSLLELGAQEEETQSIDNGDKDDKDSKPKDIFQDELIKNTEQSEHSVQLFGHSSLILLLGQLLLIMENEPDFVDLQPLKFIELCVEDDNEKTTSDKQAKVCSEWDELKAYVCAHRKKTDYYRTHSSLLHEDEDDNDNESVHSTATFNTAATSASDKTTAGTLDLECCLDVISRFVQQLYESNDIKCRKANDQANNRLYRWMDLIMIIAIAMLPCTDSAVRSKLTNGLIPNLLRWQYQYMCTHLGEQIFLEKRKHWCQLLWKRTLGIYGLPATNLLRTESYGLISKFFDFYLGLDSVEKELEAVHISLDLRFNEQFFQILQSGLRSNDSTARKYASYILKRIIDFTTKHPNTTESLSDKPWTKYFVWSSDKAQKYSELWDDWFLLYDIMHESVIHLVDPILPRFEMLLTDSDTRLDATWWILLLYRGFQNDTLSVKKNILEYIFKLQNKKSLNRLGTQHEFIFTALLKTVDVASLYGVPTQGALVSPFGEAFRFFLRNLVSSFEQEEEKIRFLRQLIHHMAHVSGCYLLILYIMEALTEIEPLAAWGSEELKALRYLVDRHRNFQIVKTKLYLRKLCISVLVRLSKHSVLTFSDVAKTVSSLITDVPLHPKSVEYIAIHKWLRNHTSNNKSVADNLKERTDLYVQDTMPDDIPVTVLRSQTNVLARMSIFVVVNEEGNIQTDRIVQLFDLLAKKITISSGSVHLFNRHLVLLDSVWDMFDHCFGSINDLLSVLRLSEETKIRLLKRMDDQYLDSDQETVTDDNLIHFLLSITRHLLESPMELSDETRTQIIKAYTDHCVALLRTRSSSVEWSKEMSKPNYLKLMRVVYDAATIHSCFVLPCDKTLTSLICGMQIKKTIDALRTRTWGDVLSTFIRFKWEAIEGILNYTTKAVNAKADIAASVFDPMDLCEQAVEQLESANELCAEAILNALKPLLAFPWDKNVEMLELFVNYASELLKENLTQSKTFPPMMRAMISTIFQPEILSRPELNENNGPVKKALATVLGVGEIKLYFVTQCAELLYKYWSTYTDAANQSMIQYSSEIISLLLFGPMRDREDQKIDAAISVKLQDAETVKEAEGTVELVFSQNDYVVRVMMNDLLLRLDPKNEQHIVFANILLDELLQLSSQDNLFAFMYTSTIEHRTKIRIMCSVMLLLDFVQPDRVDTCIEKLFFLMKKETVTSVRCYMEWAMIRLFYKFPDRLDVLYEKLADPNTKPHNIISILTVTFGLGDLLPNEFAKKYFDKIFRCLVPWLVTSHFTIRLYAYCAWSRNWTYCRKRGLNPEVEKNEYLNSLDSFLEQYSDCVKFYEKIKTQFYLTEFDGVKDFNVEFIFRQLMTIFEVIDNEKIASKAFMKLNPKPVERCPFVNPQRTSAYTAADPSELVGIESQAATKESSVSNTNNDEVSYQKKIMPWEMMLETDADLTKTLVQKKRRRNDLIVVASLVDRIPNLAGLCRTCEIFNASQLAVYSLKIKEDPAFVNISVASEKWMPMIEVPEDNVAAFLKSKKDEGYVLCGLEQTTTSATLGEFEFPEKCVLLLGKERQGVPANLLQLLDQTIEIPQYGITRSLNVHVSGAICIYEYTKQMQWRQQIPTGAMLASP
ncbi:hypothetical protein BDF14DRAFT_1987237 [Spinellus fusiger]|nr:hypothetical protein BDF14DRAFT_1987237 [Spinellus fusiger]